MSTTARSRLHLGYGSARERGIFPATLGDGARTWHIAGLALLSVRFIQGFIYWGGGSRRFIYAPLQARRLGDGHSWMANKFQTAMPGALLGTDHVIDFMLRHFWVLYTGCDRVQCRRADRRRLPDRGGCSPAPRRWCRWAFPSRSC